MNKAVKITMAIFAGVAGIALLAKRGRKSSSRKFTAPDGNTYLEDQVYKLANGDLYKNGKKLKLKNGSENFQNNHPNHDHDVIPNQYINSDPIHQKVAYHQKGKRHF